MNIKQVAPGIYRGPSPASDIDYAALRSLGIKYTLDLQTDSPLDGEPSDEVVTAKLFGITTILRPLGELAPPSNTDLNYCVGVIEQFQPIYVHCLAGVDRTGMVIAWYRMSTGWSKADAVKEMWANGYHWWYFWWIWTL